MNTLTDLKRLLDEGETLVKNGESLLRLSENIYELRYGPENWARGGWDFIAECVGDPSLWHQRDQIGAEKPDYPDYRDKDRLRFVKEFDQMKTMESMKALLDRGKTLVKGEKQLWKSEYGYSYLERPNNIRFTENFEYAAKEYIKTPSEWSELKPEKPVMMAVPIEQWEALQEELAELRRFKEANTGSVWVGEPIGKMKPEEQEMESVLFAIFDKNKEAIDNAHYNLMAVGQALVIAKDGSLECERVKFEGDNDEVK